MIKSANSLFKVDSSSSGICKDSHQTLELLRLQKEYKKRSILYKIESRMAQVPSSVYLGVAAGAMLLSTGFALASKKKGLANMFWLLGTASLNYKNFKNIQQIYRENA